MNELSIFRDIILPLLASLSFIIIVALIVKGRDDAKTFDGEVRFILYKIRNSPIELAYFKAIERDFEKLYKMPRRDREQIHVAWCEFARKFEVFMKEEQ